IDLAADVLSQPQPLSDFPAVGRRRRTLLFVAFERQAQRRELLTDRVVEVAGDAGALVLLGMDDAAQQVGGRPPLTVEIERAHTDLLFDSGKRAAQGFGGLVLRCQVSRNLDESHSPLADPRRRAAGEETRPVLSQLIALVCRTAGSARVIELARR